MGGWAFNTNIWRFAQLFYAGASCRIVEKEKAPQPELGSLPLVYLLDRRDKTFGIFGYRLNYLWM
jgi:hypothetical protein